MKIEELSVMDLATDPRESLGDKVPFFFYRYLSLFAVADSKGAQAKKSLHDAGHKIGRELVKDMMYRDAAGIAQHFEQNGMALMTVESQDGANSMVRLQECATCSGLPPVEMPLCFFEGGILAGALQALAKSTETYRAREIECTGLGHTSCLFEIGPTVQIEEE